MYVDVFIKYVEYMNTCVYKSIFISYLFVTLTIIYCYI